MRVAPCLLLIACGARTELAAPEAPPDASVCTQRQAAVACEHLRVIGPMSLSMMPVGLIPRADGFDMVWYPGGPVGTRAAEHVLVDEISITLGETHHFDNGPDDLFAAAGDRIATLYTISDQQDSPHTHFAVFDSSYARTSDIDFDDGQSLCTWHHLMCTETQCFAACAGTDGPRFATFDVVSGSITNGPNDGGFSLHGGDGATVPLACSPMITVAANSSTTYARVESQVLEVDNGNYVGQANPLVWPYDWNSIVWLSEGWTLKHLAPSGNVSILGTDGFTQDEILGEWTPTNIGLVRVDGEPTTKDPANANTTLRAHVVRPDGTITDALSFDTDGYVTQWSFAPITQGLAFAWNQQHNGLPNATKVVVIACADGS